MDSESQKLLEETFVLEKENNKMLHSMKRSMFWARVMSVLYWILIIGISVGAFYFLQPYVDQVVKTYGSFSNAIKNFQK
jgi:hypothetical protein